ncbi:MAG: hypothetical protein WBA12_13350 [Catalinimonas sp.]
MNLEDQPRDHPFRTPEGYFDELPARVQRQLPEASRRPSAVARLLQSPVRFGLPVAVVAVALFFLVRTLWQTPPTVPDATQMLAGIPEVDLLAYLEEAALDDDDLLDLALATDPNALPDTEPTWTDDAALQEELEALPWEDYLETL